MEKNVAIIVGVGAEQGLGAAICRKLASEQYHVLIAGRTVEKIEAVAAAIRSGGGSAEAIVTDATKEADVIKLFDHAFSDTNGRGQPDLVVFNAGNNQRIDFREVTTELFEEFWRIGCFAGFLVGREAARRMVPNGRGSVIFTGASGSLRGKAGYAQFAAAKAGLRMVSQSMARELGPLEIHVAHVVVDGGINGERLRKLQPAKVAEKGESGLLGLEAIAENYWHIHRQPRTAWTQELDLRPFAEVF
ncbi:SDR family NAD(P)-dependent oxidoreductase [Pseudomonas tolaasii]|uniref:SDR family NAD(P)-dependent oxidoreductase n=1 Tax=Pseudomonas tolaasii TaxID=29442 RepID=UPI001C578E56|nr:SDR family NAD(P)-dependent oxidoreductase [Pseudomonas tolaasii]MBW1248768.1 SDR family NAD(P)-dependent oxidoreductase [Pseudomonas tolaasii]